MATQGRGTKRCSEPLKSVFSDPYMRLKFKQKAKNVHLKQPCQGVVPPTTDPSLPRLQSHVIRPSGKFLEVHRVSIWETSSASSWHLFLHPVSYSWGDTHVGWCHPLFQQSDGQVEDTSVSLEYLHFCQAYQKLTTLSFPNLGPQP